MKVVLLHGPATNISRKNLLEIKQKFDQNNVIVFDPSANSGQVLASLMTPSLLSEERLIILENPDESFSDFTLYPLPFTLIFWFDHTVTEKKSIMEWIKKQKGEVKFFPESREVSVFLFLDYLASKDMKAFLEIKKLKIGGFDIFYLITMTFYLLRNLVVTPKTSPEFVRQKLERQRKNFDLEKITKLYRETLALDFKLKSGLLDQSQAEFLLVNKFIS